VQVSQVAASPDGSLVLDAHCKLYWFGSNGTISGVTVPEEVSLSNKSQFIGNHSKYSPVRIISKWSKTISLIGLTIACHDGQHKNQISLRKKILESLMVKWSEDISTGTLPLTQPIHPTRRISLGTFLNDTCPSQQFTTDHGGPPTAKSNRK
jgi:hypothetical protein